MRIELTRATLYLVSGALQASGRRSKTLIGANCVLSSSGISLGSNVISSKERIFRPYNISWPRKIIEKDPNHPKIIRTVRGVGYQLDF